MSEMKTKQYIALETEYGANNYAPLDVVITKGDGVWVEDVESNRYMDCLSAYSAVNQGHCHPKILQAMVEQAQKLTLTSRAFRNDQLGLFYKELCELTNSHKVLPMNSGAEAVETAIKVVRKSSGSAPMRDHALDLAHSHLVSKSYHLVMHKH